MKVSYILTGMGQQLLRIAYSSFSLNIIDGIVLVTILIICFKKTLTKSKNCSQPSDKQNHKSVSSPFKAIILNDTDFQSEESFLLEPSTSSTSTLELNLDPYSNIENVRSKNPNRLIIPQLNINSLRNKFDSLVETLHSNVDILSISETKMIPHFLLFSIRQKVILRIG